ncbi:unnamed protein product [Rotaria magnacalcarata]
MPKIGSCTEITCDNEGKELYECHCCLRFVCLNHLNLHVEIAKINKKRLDSVRNELNTTVNALKSIVEKKILIIQYEQNLIEQGNQILDLTNSSIDDLQNISEKIYKRIESSRSEEFMVKLEPSLSETKNCSCVCKCNKKNDVTQESEISKNNEYSTDITQDFIDLISSDETAVSIENENSKEEKLERQTYRNVFNTCPLTFDGAYGLTEAHHFIEFCEHGSTDRMELYLHFIRKHHLKKICAQRLALAVADNQDPKTKLFDENEYVIGRVYKVPCLFINGQSSLSEFNGQNVLNVPCQHRLVALNRFKRHLQFHHKISASSAKKLVHRYKKNQITNDTVWTPRISLTRIN